jgi:hypothetical protein
MRSHTLTGLFFSCDLQDLLWLFGFQHFDRIYTGLFIFVLLGVPENPVSVNLFFTEFEKNVAINSFYQFFCSIYRLSPSFQEVHPVNFVHPIVGLVV